MALAAEAESAATVRQPRWDGSRSMAALVVYMERVGDMLQFIRYSNEWREKRRSGARVRGQEERWWLSVRRDDSPWSRCRGIRSLVAEERRCRLECAGAFDEAAVFVRTTLSTVATRCLACLRMTSWLKSGAAVG